MTPCTTITWPSLPPTPWPSSRGRIEPELILFPPTFDSRDVAGRLQAMLGCTLMANADDLLAVDRALARASH